ncbi:hypothetical protein VDS59_11690 (plasmid) [Levilactobacillus brevis]|uniref:hypothetical protein n=1 Tax=Levilactobacillus brevis TaxID=1580 RepID=UPI002F90A5F3
MNGKQLITALVTISLPFGFGITASAKTHNLKISVNKLTDRSTYISGKTSAKANVSVTRNGIIYAKGKSNSKGLFKIKASNPLSGNWHYRVTAAKKGYKTTSKYVLVSSKSSKQASKSTQDQIKALNKKIADLQKQISSLNQNPQTVYVNNSTNQSSSSDSYDKNKDYWTGTSQKLYVYSPKYEMTLYKDGNVERDLLAGSKVSADRVWGATDSEIVTIKAWINNAVNGMYPVEYNGQKLFAISSDVTQIDADNSGKQMYYYKNPGSSDPCYMANYAPQEYNITVPNDTDWVQYTSESGKAIWWTFSDGTWKYIYEW